MNTSINTASSQHPVIAGHEIVIDEHGRFSLNAIHHAGGDLPHKRPSQWARRDEAKELIAELSQSADLHFEPLRSIRGGAHRGTYAHELLAVSYAGWISPKFQLQVNQVFLDYRMGRLQQLEQQYGTLPSPLTPAHQRSLQRAIARRAQSLPESQRRTAYARIYSHLKDRFEVASYKDVPDARFTEALGAVESVALDGEFMPKSEALANPDDSGIWLNADEVCSLIAMCSHAKWMSRRWQSELGPALSALGSRHANECHEHIMVAARIAHSMQRKAGVLPLAT